MFSRFRNETYPPPPRFHVAFFFFLFLVFKRTTIDTWRGQAVVRQARKRAARAATGARKREGGKTEGGVAGWRLIFCSLASASSSASGRPHFARAAQLRVERDHPSSCPPFRSRSTPLLFPPHTLRSSVVSDLSQPTLAFVLSTILENARDDERRRSC